MSAESLRVLHVGCGRNTHADLPPPFNGPPWQEVRLDIDRSMAPDIVASITNMAGIASASFDAVWSSHSIEHLYAHEVPQALAEFVRILSPKGFAVIQVPDLETVAEAVIGGRLLVPAYVAPAGAVAPLDILFGYRPALAAGNHYMAHRTGFTAASLRQVLLEAGFASVAVRRDGSWAVCAVASRSIEDSAATEFMADNLALLSAGQAQG
jgi:SAM-dependent methyltransferase